MKPVPCTQTCVWQFAHSKVFVSILEVLEKYSCRILRSTRPSTPNYRAVYAEYTGTFPLPTMPPFSSTTPPLATTHDSPTHKHIVHTKEHHT